MNAIELVPSLSHYIETTAGNEFWSSANHYVECEQRNKKLEGKTELLKGFLESADVKKGPQRLRETYDRSKEG